jgi:hypothetical protein
MKAHTTRLFTIGVVVLGAACGGSSPTTPATVTLTSLAITGSPTIDLIGATIPLVATAMYSDGTGSNVTASTQWTSSNPSTVTVSPLGVATAVDIGLVIITATYQGRAATAFVRVGAPIDCFLYAPSSLGVLAGSEGYTIITPFGGADFSRLDIFDTAADAAKGLALYRRYNNHCHVGRSNTRANRLDYVHSYWLNSSFIETTIEDEDCEPYTPSSLQITSLGAAGWSVSAGGRQLLLLDTGGDATTMMAMLKTYSNQCYIGRGNTRPTPSAYVMVYWK